jgi:Protein of unknown function (DUF434)
VPDKRTHRGPHPVDAQLFAPENWPQLQAAVADLSWLLGRGYASVASLKLVGDRYRLDQRQRAASAGFSLSSMSPRSFGISIGPSRTVDG